MHGRFTINGGHVPGLPPKSTPMFGVNIYVRSKIYLVRSSHDLCARERAQRRGNIGHVS